MPGSPRIAPGSRAEIGLPNSVIVAVIGWAAGGRRPPNLFTTLARHRRLFRSWLRFAGGLMPRGALARADTELVILRVAHNCDCEYEWSHHERIARVAGFSAAEVGRVRSGPDAEGWTPRQALVLRAVDELHGDRVISQETWDGLAGFLSEKQLLELCLLTGHYEMLAMTIRSAGIQPDPGGGGMPRIVRALQGRRG